MFKFREIKFLKIFFMFFICAILIFCILKFTYSKFIQSVEVNSVSGIANFASSVSFSQDEILKEELNGDEIVYEFCVQNFSQDISNEVKSKYNIILELSQENPPLIIELYRNKNGQDELIELENYSTKAPEIFNVGDKSVNYKIKVKYDKNNKTTILQEGFNIKMKIVTIQEEG